MQQSVLDIAMTLYPPHADLSVPVVKRITQGKPQVSIVTGGGLKPLGNKALNDICGIRHNNKRATSATKQVHDGMKFGTGDRM
eukprot:3772072-Alexandrium_andersonii.AAC.1